MKDLLTQAEIELLLEKLIPAIEDIDGGCPYCIKGFCDKTNEIIKEYGFKYDYNDALNVFDYMSPEKIRVILVKK